VPVARPRKRGYQPSSRGGERSLKGARIWPSQEGERPPFKLKEKKERTGRGPTRGGAPDHLTRAVLLPCSGKNREKGKRGTKALFTERGVPITSRKVEPVPLPLCVDEKKRPARPRKKKKGIGDDGGRFLLGGKKKKKKKRGKNREEGSAGNLHHLSGENRASSQGARKKRHIRPYPAAVEKKKKEEGGESCCPNLKNSPWTGEGEV